MASQKTKKYFIWFSIICATILIIELGLRVIYFQFSSRNIIAYQTLYHYVKEYVVRANALSRLEQLNIPENFASALFGKEGVELLATFKKQYATEFSKLITVASKVKAKVIVVYIPSQYGDYNGTIATACRSFYRQLCEKHDIDFIDLTKAFTEERLRAIYLLPWDGHLSPYGNYIVARQIAHDLKGVSHKSDYISPDRSGIMGDLKPNSQEIWEQKPEMPYRMVINRQGFRMDHDLNFPKSKMRILVLGDSFTMGPYVSNAQTFPAQIKAIMPNLEVINAGVAGYNIADEASLFEERAKHCEPDVVILQVLDNDLSDFFYFKRNLFDRKRMVHTPSALEKKYLNALQKNKHM